MKQLGSGSKERKVTPTKTTRQETFLQTFSTNQVK